MILGLDFDNTLIGYDHVFSDEAAKRGWIVPGNDYSKKELRDALRTEPEGELKWQNLQAAVYGTRIGEARLLDGVAEFFRACRGRQIYIVSHKTRYARQDPGGIDLRAAARDWMAAQGFFDSSGFGLDPGCVFFESSRRKKIARIAALGCTDFVDDLEEVFAEPDFPGHVRRHLYAPGRKRKPTGPFVVYDDWREIADALL